MTTVSLKRTAAPADVERASLDHITGEIEALAALRSQIAALKQEEVEVLALIHAELGDARIGTVDGADAVRLDERTNSSLDREQVKALLGPEVYGTVLRLTPYIATALVGRFKRSANK
jgi:hypothetical protein